MKKLLLTLLFVLLISTSLYAYIDPGTGSYVIQVVIAGFLGILYAIKTFWQNIVNFFKNIFKKQG